MAEASRAGRKFDCIRFMRYDRARIGAAPADMTIEEQVEWFNSRRYSDPVLEALASRIRKSTQDRPTDRLDC